ncbi:MAG: sulfurtransferase [Microbacterium sp.]
MSDILITPDELAELTARDEHVRILDVRYRLDKPDGREDHRSGHIPGAVYVDLDAELAARGVAADGRHPLPGTPDLQQAARRWGVNDGDTVVVYDDYNSVAASRAWWLLTDAGVDARILDGALRGWVSAGHALEQGETTPVPGTVTLSAGRLPQLTTDGAAQLAATGILIDVRAAERYRGETESIDPVAGHIPGARNVPFAELLDERRRLKNPEQLRQIFTEVGATPDEQVGVYCGSGVTASLGAAALREAGFAPRLYPGSWSAWSSTPGRPVVVGSKPFGE